MVTFRSLVIAAALISAISLMSPRGCAEDANIDGFDPKAFTFRGEPIHPLMIRSFTRIMADDWMPYVISVDLIAAYRTDQDFGCDVYEDGGFVRCRDDQGSKPFYYRWAGVTPKGVHVIDAHESFPGGAERNTILLIAAERRQGIAPDGTAYNQCALRLVRAYPLGDARDYTVKVTERGALVKLPDKEVAVDDTPRAKADSGPLPKNYQFGVF